MKCDRRNASRFTSGCGHGEDCHEYIDGTATTKNEKISCIYRRSYAGAILYDIPGQYKSIRIAIID